MMQDKLEHVAQGTAPISVGVGGLTFLGVTLQEWVLLMTALLLIFQLIVMAPKAFRTLIGFGARLIGRG